MADKCSNCEGTWAEENAPLTGTQRRRCESCESVQVRTQYGLSSLPSHWQWEKRNREFETLDKCRCCNGFFIEGKPVIADCGGHWVNIQHRRCNKCQLADGRKQYKPHGRWTDWKLYESPPHVGEMLEAMRKQFHENREKYRVKSFETLCKQLSRAHIFRR